jgi:2-isopropylmalate synthase
MAGKQHVRVFDTTLRDGEQAPGFSLRPAEKLELARQLDRLGVDIIEAGFPVASPADAEAVRRISQEVRRPVIACLARCHRADLERAVWAIEPAAQGRVHTFIATSDLHLKAKLRISREQCLEAAVDAVRYARHHTYDVQFSAEDATRSDFEFLCRVVEAVIRAGATTINLPDTVGYATPEDTREFFRNILERVPNSDKVVFSAHCHDDLGLGVANSLAAMQGGARQVECTVNGIGERAGNAALEEIVMALHVRADRFPYTVAIDRKQLFPSSELLTRLTNQPVQVNKAVVGRNAFSHEAGIHQDGVLKDRRTYEIMRAEDVGAPWNPLVLGKHSGRHAVQRRCSELGLEIEITELREVYRTLMEIADEHKVLTDEHVRTAVHTVRATLRTTSLEPHTAAIPALHESGYGHGV